MSLRLILVALLFCGVMLPADRLAPAFYTHERDAGPGRALARLTSHILFNTDRSAEAPFLAYGYLSRVHGLPAPSRKDEDESSAVLTFVVEGRVVDVDRSDTTFMIRSEGALRVFFAQHGKRNFSQPNSFRRGEEVATYNLKRYVFFSSTSDQLQDRSFASLVASKPFALKGAAIDLQQLWGTQLIIEAQALGGETLPSPLPEYSAAMPYTGSLFIGGERAER
jgi:hypothetical protein